MEENLQIIYDRMLAGEAAINSMEGIRITNEGGRIDAEILRQEAEGQREIVKDTLQGWLNNPEQFKGDTGEQGIQGETGKSIEYTWDGTQLGVRIEGETDYTYVNLKGDKGDIGNTGKGIEFTWDGTQLGIKQEGDIVYQYTNLKGTKGDTGDTGDKGDTGNGLEFTLNGTQLGIRVEGETQYQYVDLKGDKGDIGDKGDTGDSLEFNWNGTQLGVRVEGDATYQYVNLKGDRGDKGNDGYTPVKDIDYFDGETGEQGIQGETGLTGKSLEFIWNGNQLGVRVEGEAQYQYVDLKGEKGNQGDTGNGISSIVKTSGTGAAGTTDTYTITFTNDTTTTFQVYNGANGEGAGDMLMSRYDTNQDGKVNAADTADSVPWDGISDKPSTFTPSAHNHTKSEITDFPVTLPADGGNADTVGGKYADDFANASHNHTKSQITDFPSTMPPSAHNHAISEIDVLQDELGDKVDNSRVLTDVPSNAKFTDTITTINGKTGAILKADIVALGIPTSDTNTTYTEITTAEIDAGTASTLRTITARRLKYLLDKIVALFPSKTSELTNDSGFLTSVTKSDVDLGNVDNTSDLNKPISTATQTALNGKVDNSRVLTDVPLNAKFTDTNTITTINGKTGTILKADIVALGIPSADTNTITTINGKTGEITKADIVALGIPAQDTVYTHPSSHSPSIISQDTNNRFVTDTEKATWSGKSNFSGSYTDLTNKPTIPDTSTLMPISGGVLENYVEKLTTLTGTSNAINLSLGNVFTHTLSGNSMYSIINGVSGQAHSFTLIITQTATVRTVTFSGNIKWQGGEIPDLTTANKTYVLTFMSIDGGETWLGMFGGEFCGIPDYYVMATDSDFNGTSDGTFTHSNWEVSHIIIPDVIKGVPVTSYTNMFAMTNVIGVASNNPNVTDMSHMFENSQATTLDLRYLDTSNVTDMSNMFQESQATTLDLSSFDTSNVTDMSSMFQESRATTLDLSSFDTSNVNLMGNMFVNSQATTLDLSSFNTSNVTDMSHMFENSQATTGYARTQADADRFNNSSDKPSALVFVVK